MSYTNKKLHPCNPKTLTTSEGINTVSAARFAFRICFQTVSTQIAIFSDPQLISPPFVILSVFAWDLWICLFVSKMEDAKPEEVPMKACDLAASIQDRFGNLCKVGLGLEERTLEEALTLFRECKHVLLENLSVVGSGSPEEVERYWTAFALYCVSKLKRDAKQVKENVDARLTLSAILRVTKINLVEFFREIPQFMLKTGGVLLRIYGLDWEKRLELKEVQANFDHLKLLNNHYKRAFVEFFLSNDPSNIDSTTGSGSVSEYHRLGWLLFLSLRMHAFSRFKDLVTCTNGLVSILAILILHVPVRLRKFSVLDSARLVKKSDKGLDLLASLCAKYQTSENDLMAAMEKTNSLIIDTLKKKPCPASECKSECLKNIDTDGLTYFEDLMEESSLQSNLLVLEKDYDDAIQIKGEIDERMFVNDEDSSIGNGRLSRGTLSICKPKRAFCSMDSPAKTMASPMSPPRSPASPATVNSLGIKVPPTPVTAAMTTAKWLRNVISPLPSKPSQELERFLLSCDRDVRNDVTHRANIILEAIFPSKSHGDRSISGTLQNVTKMDSIWAEERKSEALKLYYRVLETMCRAESHFLNATNLTPLLSRECFHRCMLACSAELVLATHKTITIMFPDILERTGITAFDMSKVIESFVRHEETLPRELKRHLNTFEEHLLESLAWEKGSSMYNSLIVAKPLVSAEINRLGLLADPMPSLDSITTNYNISNGRLSSLPLIKRDSPDKNGEMRSPKRVCTERSVAERNSFTSPVKERLLTSSSLKSKLPHLQSAFATPTRPNPAGGGETYAETIIHIFFTKILKLAANRIKSLCEKMQLPHSHKILERVYFLIQQILSQRTSLFFNRHIDQLVLCSFYGVAKISQLTLTFKEIINSYKKQPQCKPQVFRSVFIDWSTTSREGKIGQEHVDIITFYNEVFIPSVKPLLVELGPGSTVRNNRFPEDGASADGQCPGSPRLTPFPTLPDMSPKKVSASHNVYVSPLRSSKMDTLLSPSSTSYYAFVGESTHAYQSPSKDLTAINNRLNCSHGNSRKLKLNFDMVSDSLVAGSLCPQNGNSMLNPIVKSEQPDQQS